MPMTPAKVSLTHQKMAMLMNRHHRLPRTYLYPLAHFKLQRLTNKACESC